jgi:uncharacterized integral membrane protein
MDPHADPTELRDTSSEAPTADGSVGEPIREYRGSGIMWSGVAVIVSMALLVLIAFQNTQDVGFDFLWFDVAIPLIAILAITAGIAVVATETIGFIWRHRRRRVRRDRDELKRLRRQQS